MSRVLITGARGFLGRALIKAARKTGATVIATTRDADTPDWSGDTGITALQVDLGDPGAVDRLTGALGDVTAVIHAAASFSGNADAHTRDTITATDHVIQALEKAGSKTRLILVSSLSVYDVASMDSGIRLDEKMRLVETASQRDAYAAAKAAQEKCVRRYQGPKQVIRPGAIYGPHRLWSAQLGFAKMGFVFCPNPSGLIPAIDVTRAAAAIVEAALNSDETDVVNLIDPNPPTRADWLKALGLRIVPVPLPLVFLGGALTGRGPAWQARFRPLFYDTARAEALLDPDTEHPFSELVGMAKRNEEAMP